LYFSYNLFKQKIKLQNTSEVLPYYFPITAVEAENLLGKKKSQNTGNGILIR
jgi:hypothetical protein